MVEAYGQYRWSARAGTSSRTRPSFWFLIADGLLEPVRRRRAGLPDQPAGRQLLRARLLPDRGPRPRRADGRLRHARHRAGAVLAAQHGRPAVLEGEVAEGRLLGPEHRPDGHDPAHAAAGRRACRCWRASPTASGRRALEFYAQPLVHTLLWLRIVPDSVFIGVGVLPLVAAAVLRLPEPPHGAGSRSGGEAVSGEERVLVGATGD